MHYSFCLIKLTFSILHSYRYYSFTPQEPRLTALNVCLEKMCKLYNNNIIFVKKLLLRRSTCPKSRKRNQTTTSSMSGKALQKKRMRIWRSRPRTNPELWAKRASTNKQKRIWQHCRLKNPERTKMRQCRFRCSKKNNNEVIYQMPMKWYRPTNPGSTKKMTQWSFRWANRTSMN